MIKWIGIIMLGVLLAGSADGATTTNVVATGYIPYFDMVVDSNGKAHIAYDDVIIDKLYYTNNVTGSWQAPEFISGTSDVGDAAVSLDVDSDGKIHIAFDSGSGGNDVFTYTQNTAGVWSTEVVRTTSRWYSLAVDAANRPHVAYYYDDNGLNYALKSGGSWSHQNVDSSGYVTAYTGRYPDIALDSSGKAHIIYFDYLSSSIKYANNSAGSWNIENVVSGVSWSGAIALDSANNPHVAYAKNGNIIHSQRTGSGWINETVATGSYEVNNAALIDIALDASGIPYILYTDPNRKSLLLSEKTSGTWRQFVFYTASSNYALWGGVLSIFNGAPNAAVSDTNANQLLYLKGFPDTMPTPTPTSTPNNSIGYSTTVATGQNTYVQSSNGTFGLLLKGQSKTINNSVILNNTGDISAKVEARFNDSIGGVFGLVSGANVLNATNFALGLPSALMPLSNIGADVQVAVAPPGATALDARLGVPTDQPAGDYSGTVILTFSNLV